MIGLGASWILGPANVDPTTEPTVAIAAASSSAAASSHPPSCAQA